MRVKSDRWTSEVNSVNIETLPITVLARNISSAKIQMQTFMSIAVSELYIYLE
jgi:hypothetical protein